MDISYLELQITSFKWMFGSTTISHVKSLESSNQNKHL